MTLVFMFPGQSSKYPGMLHKLGELHAKNRDLLAGASDIVGRDLDAHYREDNADAFKTNTDVQLGVFLANHMFLQILEDAGIHAEASLGLSLGEWNHVVHIGALSFRDALLAVQQRGAAYDAGPRGSMASVFPIGEEELSEVARRAAGDDVLEVVNLNSPRQQVLSGATPALERALKILDDEFHVSAVVIEKEVPMHSSLFAPVGGTFAKYLAGLTFAEPKLPYLPNRLAQLIEKPDKARFVELLSTHVHEPVLWRKSIELVRERWPEAALCEVGPKSVLFNLLDRKWQKEIKKFRTDDTKDPAKHIEELIASLRELQ